MRRTMQRAVVSEAFGAIEDLEPRVHLSSSFNPTGPIVYGTGERVSSVVVADFDADGTQDMVVAAGRSLQLLRGLGAGRFAAPHTIATFNAPVGLAVAGNFDGDTRPDLFVVQQTATPSGRGWTRLLLNLGNGNFFVTSYGRLAGLRAGSLTVGNVDSDALDEVVLIGDREIVEAVVNPPNQELRVLDPRFAGGPTAQATPSAGDLPFAAQVRMVQTATLRGSSMTAPTIVRRGQQGDVYIAMADGSQDADGSMRVYTYEEFPPQIPENPPAPPRLDLLTSSPITGRPTSVALAQLFGDATLDAVVTTIGPDSTPGLAGSVAAVFGRTSALLGVAPTGGGTAPTFQTFQVLHTRVLGGEGSGPVGLDQYHLVKVSDLNSDGLLDIALSVVDGDGAGGAHVQLVELIQSFPIVPFAGAAATPAGNGPLIPLLQFTPIIQWSQTTTGVTDDTARSFALTHVLADLRSTGRDDLIILDRPTATGATGLRVVQNTLALKRPRIIASSIASADVPQHAGPQAPRGSMWDLHVDVKTPDAMRFIRVDNVRMYRDSNRNGVLDANDELLGEATPDPALAVVTDFDGVSHWTLQVTIGSVWPRGVQKFFAIARDSNDLESQPTLVGSLTIVA